jgi:hypothetical protein
LVIALVILQVGLLGVVGILVSASRWVARAALIEGALALAQPVADSILAVGWSGGGEAVAAPFRAQWSEVGGDLRIRVLLDPDGEELVRLILPGGVGW